MSKFKKISAIVLSASTLAWTIIPVVSAATAADIQTQINALLAQIQTLQSQLSSAGGSVVGVPSITRDLTVGSKGADVTSLQKFLNAQGYPVAASGPGSVGNETTYFGNATKAALAKYQAAKGISPAAGYFGAKSRAYLASVAAGGTTTTATTTTTTTGGGTTTATSTAAGGLSVSLTADNPIAQVIPTGVNELIPVLKLNFTAGSGAVNVTGLSITRGGLSADADLSSVYLMDGNKVLVNNLGITNGVISFSSAGNLFTVNANSNKVITVAVSLVAGASTHTMNFSLASTTSITSNATNVTGIFPIAGNIMTAASVTNIGGLTIINSSVANLTTNAGQLQYLVGQFSVTAQSQAVQVKSIKFTNVGTTGSSDIANFDLFNGATMIKTVAGLASDNTVTFDLSANPIQLTSGQTAVLYVYNDINGGVFRNYQLTVQHNYDIVAQDMMYNVGFLPTITSGGAGGTTSFPLNLAYVTISQGSLVVTRDANSAVNYIVPGATNFTVAKIDFKAIGEAIRITNLNVVLSGATTTGLANLKVIDDLGQQIGTTQATLGSNTTSYTGLNYVISANTTRVVSVILDLAATGGPTTLSATINTVIGQGYTSLALVTSGGASGNTLSAVTNTLSAFQNTAIGSVNIVAGKVAAKIASFSLVAGGASAVQVSGITLAIPSASSTASFQNLYVMNGTTQVGTTQSALSSSMTFTPSAQINVPAGGQALFDVFADVKTTATTNWANATSVVNLTTVNGIVSATNQAVTGVPSSALAGQQVSVLSAGTSTLALYNAPVGAQVGMGTTGVKLATYKITGSQSEALTLTNVYLRATSTTGVAFTNFRLMSGTIQYGSSLNLQGATAPSYSLTWNGVNIPVPLNGYVILDVLADANTWANIQPTGVETVSQNATTTVLMYQNDVIGVDSSQATSTTNANAGNTFNLLRTTLGVTTASGVSYGGAYSRYLVGAFTMAAGTGSDVTLASTTIGLLISNASTTATGTVLTVYDVTQAVNIASSTVSSTGTQTLIPNVVTTTIPLGTSKTFYVYADVSNFTTKPLNSPSSITASLSLTNVSWSDGTEVGLTINPAITTPIGGSPSAVVVVQ